MRRGVGDAMNAVLRRRGLELRRVDPTRDPRSRHVHPIREFSDRAVAIERRHGRQTPDDVAALRRKYSSPVIGRVRVWELLERLSLCIDPTDRSLFCASQQVHVLQVMGAMHDDGVVDPDLLLAGLIHDLGKLLLLTGEDPANVVCANSPLSGDPGAGLASAVFRWNHDEFSYSRFKDHVPEHVAWLIRFHSMDPSECAPLMDEQDREWTQRYFTVFTRYDHGTKSPFDLPTRPLSSYRDMVEQAFPKPIVF